MNSYSALVLRAMMPKSWLVVSNIFSAHCCPHTGEAVKTANWRAREILHATISCSCNKHYLQQHDNQSMPFLPHLHAPRNTSDDATVEKHVSLCAETKRHTHKFRESEATLQVCRQT